RYPPPPRTSPDHPPTRRSTDVRSTDRAACIPAPGSQRCSARYPAFPRPAGDESCTSRSRVPLRESTMRSMAKITMVVGMLLLIEGMIFYLAWRQLGAQHQSPTALIPAFVGVPLMLLGWLTLAKPNLRMHLMHAAVTLTLLGFLASAPMGVI